MPIEEREIRAGDGVQTNGLTGDVVKVARVNVTVHTRFRASPTGPWYEGTHIVPKVTIFRLVRDGEIYERPYDDQGFLVGPFYPTDKAPTTSYDENPRSPIDDDYGFGGIDGCVEIFKTKTSGEYGSVYVGEDPQAGRWMAICEGHNTNVGDTSIRGAKSSARDPLNFCDECRNDASPNRETVAHAARAYEQGTDARRLLRRFERGQ